LKVSDDAFSSDGVDVDPETSSGAAKKVLMLIIFLRKPHLFSTYAWSSLFA